MDVPDIEMGVSRFGTPDLSSRLDSPREPKVSRWRTRVLSSTCPAISTIVSVGTAALSLYAFLGPERNDIIGGFCATLSIFACCNAGAFWKYYFQANWGEQADAVEEQLEAQRRTLQEQRENTAEYKDAIDHGDQLAEKLTQLHNAEAQQLVVNAPQEAEFVQKLTSLFKQLNDNLPEQLRPVIEELTQLLSTLKNTGTAQKHQLELMQTLSRALGQFQEHLEKNVQEIKLENASLKEKIKQLETNIAGFRQHISQSLAEFNTVKKERDQLKGEFADLKEARQAITDNVHQGDKMVHQLEEIVGSYEKIVSQLQALKHISNDPDLS